MAEGKETDMALLRSLLDDEDDDFSGAVGILPAFLALQSPYAANFSLRIQTRVAEVCECFLR